MKKDVVLLITHSGDFYTIDNVEAAVSRMGYRPFRFNSDEFPQMVQLSVGVTGAQSRMELRVPRSGLVIDKDEIRSVWMRKLGTPKVSLEMEVLLRRGCVRESKAMLDIFLNQLQDVPWIDRRSTVSCAEDKLFQLRTAQASGLNVPRTLITNDPRQVRDFFELLKGNVVAKMLTPLTTSMSGGTPFVYTSRIGPEDLDDLDQLRFSPMVFQEFIPKSCELRIAYVNGRLFTGAIDGDKVDWRNDKNRTEGSPWQLFEVPEHMAEKIRLFMNKTGLYFGALDVLVGPDGEFTFLEVNPNGEWGMLERDLQLPISTAIAETLIQL